MHSWTIAVIGPTDLVDEVSEIVDATEGVRALRLPYQHESETTTLMRSVEDEVDGWLFTGIIPYALAHRGTAPAAVAAYVSNGHLGFLSALVRIATTHGHVPHISVDTIPTAAIASSLAGTDIDLATVDSLGFTASTSSADFVEFHRRAARAHQDNIALTCVRSVFEELDGEIPVVRLRPSTEDIRRAVDMLVLSIASERSLDQTAVVGLLTLSDDDDVATALSPLAGEIVRTAPGRYLVLTTRGPFEEATSSMSAAGFLEPLTRRHPEVHMGFGLAGSVAEASSRATHALGRARMLGQHSAVVATRGGDDHILAIRDAPAIAPTLPTLQARTGIRLETLTQIKDAATTHGGRITAAQLAERLGLVDRSARRILAKLERGGGASSKTSDSSGAIGRPRTEYELRY
jgi:hypothetical protein